MVPHDRRDLACDTTTLADKHPRVLTGQSRLCTSTYREITDGPDEVDGDSEGPHSLGSSHIFRRPTGEVDPCCACQCHLDCAEADDGRFLSTTEFFPGTTLHRASMRQEVAATAREMRTVSIKMANST